MTLYYLGNRTSDRNANTLPADILVFTVAGNITQTNRTFCPQRRVSRLVTRNARGVRI